MEDVLWFGSSGRALIENYLNRDKIYTYNSVTRELNLPVASRMLSRGSVSGEGYLKAFLELTQPRFALTFEDNFPNFYLIKKYLPTCTTIAIQNGRRDYFSHQASSNFFTTLSQLAKSGARADVVCTFGDAPAALYKASLANTTTRYCPIGSLKNNALPITHDIESSSPQRLLFISSLPNSHSSPELSDWKRQTIGFYGANPLTFAEMYEAERIVSNRCARYAQQHNLEMIVLGKRPAYRSSEEEFYRTAIHGLPWKLMHPQYQSSNYTFVRSSDVVVTIDSTLGYELFARGIRVGFVSIRLSLIGLDAHRDCDFGFPLVTNRAGPLWTSIPDDDEIDRVIAAAAEMRMDDIEQIVFEYSPIIMRFDPGNSRLTSLFTELGLPNQGPSLWSQDSIPKE